MDEQRFQAYLALIYTLLNCPVGDEPAVLQQYQFLIDEEFIAVARQVAQMMAREGNHLAAQRLQQIATQIEAVIGNTGHPSVMLQQMEQAFAHLAQLNEQGRYDEAIRVGEQAFSLAKNLYGEEHEEIELILFLLGTAYQKQKRYGEAESCYKQSLAMLRKWLGDNHPKLANFILILARLYQEQGRYQEAEPLYLEALALRKRLLGDDHPHVATSLNNLAMLYQDQGRYQEAEPLCQQGLYGKKGQKITPRV